MKPSFLSTIVMKSTVLNKLNCLVNSFSLMLCILALGFSSPGVWAGDDCSSVKGNKDFEVTVQINSYDPSQDYDVTYTKIGTTTLWSNHDVSAIFYDTSLEEGQKYLLKFIYNSAADTLTLYKNKNDAELWSQGDTRPAELHGGSSVFEDSGADGLICHDGGNVTPPPAIPDVCELVPDTLQSNYYADGSVYGNLSTTPGAGNKIYLPTDDTEMSFGSTFSTDCYYPEAGGPVNCKIDPNKFTPGYPFELEDHFTGETLTIAAGETQSLEAGEYWFDSITFGGDKSSLTVNGMVVIHYKQLVIPATGSDTRIYINDGGAPRNLLFIGHGPNAALVTDQSSAAITSYAHYYIANESDQGLTLGGSHSVFYGGLGANAVSLSGVDNEFNGNGSCADPDPDPEPTPGICTLFPDGGIQGNHYENGAPQGNDIQIIDGSGGKGNRLYLDTRIPVSFNTTSTGSSTSTLSGCVYGSDPNGNSIPFSSATPERCIIDEGANILFDGAPYVPEDFSDGAGDIVVDKFSADDQNNVTPVNIEPGKYNSLTVGVDGIAILSPGEYWFSTLNLGDGGENGQIKITDDANQDNPVIVHYKKVNFNGSGIYINSKAGPDRKNTAADTPDEIEGDGDSSAILFIGHGVDSSVNPTVNDIYINAGWYISPEATAPGFDIEASARFQMIGAVSAPGVKMFGAADYTYFYPQDIGNCTTPPPEENYTIEVTPDEGYSLSCDAPNITFTVKDDSGEIATDYDGYINATFPNGLVPDNANIIQGKVIDADNNVYQPVDGQVIVPVSSGEYKSYEVKGELADDTSQVDTGNIEFVPFAFYIDDQHVIASKAQSVEVKALACDSDTHDKVAVSYSGTPEVSSTLQEPNGGVGTLSFEPVFASEDNGETSTDLTFTDSGKVAVTIEDKNFDCTGYEGCPIGEDGQSDGVMKGGFTVYARPWTFAICDAQGSKMDGTITDSASLGYKAAGQEFDLYVRPLRWVSGNTDPVIGAENIDVTDMCDKPSTQNYLSSGSPDSTMQLSYELAQPGADVGHAGSLSGTQSLANTESSGTGESGYYNFSQLAWSEVGVLTVKMDTAEDYYGMNINQGYRNIGRFYPDHLSILENTWSYAEGHNGFAYMNQPIGMSYTIEARNANDQPTQNYGYFTESLQAQLKLVGVDEHNMNLDERFYVGDKETDTGWSSVTPVSDRNAQYVYTTDNFEFFKLAESTEPYVSTPDGPFDTDDSNWGMEVTDETTDQVNFDFNDNDNSFTVDTLNEKAMAFSEKPDFRYGRMVLDSVSSPIGGPVSVPLRAEFWSGNNYEVNQDDNGSQFKTNVYCAVNEDTSESSGSALLTDTDNDKIFHLVSDGKSSIVQAKQSTAQREMVRIFLRQGSNDGDFHHSNPQPASVDCEWNNSESIDQPWLQFNWRDQGDEDPSTVVTFGAYRGNDRIIFRGEEQLTDN